jgi:hypothetical protein
VTTLLQGSSVSVMYVCMKNVGVSVEYRRCVSYSFGNKAPVVFIVHYTYVKFEEIMPEVSKYIARTWIRTGAMLIL